MRRRRWSGRRTRGMFTGAALAAALVSFGWSSHAAAGDETLDNRRVLRAERAAERLDRRGDAIERRLDRLGDRSNRRLDRRAERAAAAGHDRRAERLDRKGDRRDAQLDLKGERINERLDRRGERRVNRARREARPGR